MGGIKMKIKWLGHACFLLTASDGTRLVTDPYDNTIGYPPLDVEAYAVAISHDHFDHNHLDAVKGAAVRFDKPGEYTFKDIKVRGLATYHDEVKGKKRGENVVFLFSMDGLTICHCGDLGHIPEEDVLKEMGKADILLIPVGGTFTIDGDTAASLVKKLNPTLVMPMHYKNNYLNFSIDGVAKFLKACGVADEKSAMTGKQEIEVTPQNIKGFPKVSVLEFFPAT
jgi:L-ascorbate metabolism protein UlaG (beta-lactamase superfamily)